MASSPTPTTPDNAPRRTFMNRSVTAPIRTSPATVKPPPEIGATEGVETLYTHPNASIVKFTTISSRPSSSSPSRQHGNQTPLLPWTSTTERTVAAGPLSVYRVPGSVSFLNSGNLLHAILPRSQCWCVDGVSKFALRVLPDTYYRIELPEDDAEEVERLKLVLAKVCFYERTPCPFERAFDVEIEDEAELDVRKKSRHSIAGPAKRWRLERGFSWKPEGWKPRDDGPGRNSEDGRPGGEIEAGSEVEDDDAASVREEDEPGVEKLTERAKEVKVTTPSRVKTARRLLEQRSVTAPAAQLSLQSPPSKLRTRVDADGTVEVAEPTTSESAGNDSPAARLRTFQAIPTDMPPSPPDSSAGAEHGEGEEASGEQPSALRAPSPEHGYFDRAAVEDTTQSGADEAVEDITQSGADEAAEEGDTVTVPETSIGSCKPGQDSVTTEEVEAPPEVHATSSLASTPDRELGVPPQVSRAEAESAPLAPQQRPSTPPNATAERRSSDPFAAEPLTKTPSRPSSTRSRSRSPNKVEDPFAAIQARILARRSIGGTITSFHPPPASQPPPTRSSASSSSSTSSTLSTRPHHQQNQRAFATAMVRKACSVFLGPPAHLVALMLRIAARFAKGAFGVDGVFHVESPRGWEGRVPGSYQVFEGDGGGKEEGEGLEEWEEDDFGVPLRSPVRLASGSSLREGSRVRERRERGWDVD